MATLSVLNYNNLSPGLNMKVNGQSSSSNVPVSSHNLGKTFNKITVQNVLSESNSNTLNITKGNPNAIVRKIKDFGMIGSVNNAAGAASLNMNPRKRSLVESKQTQKPVESKPTPTASKKPKISKEERTAMRLAKKAAKENANLAKAHTKQQIVTLQQHTKIPGTPGRKGLPLPQAVARRNARERNRVKQVNNGFAALRERIPEEVAEVFENQGSNRSAGKKLSKVETLRMAVEYIRSLERLLGFDFPVGPAHRNSPSGEESFSLIKDEFDIYSPAMEEEHFDDSLSHYDSEDFFSSNTSNQQTQLPSSSPHDLPLQQLDMLPNITTLNGLQYIRIPGTNTYQLLTPDIFVGTVSSPPSSTVDEEHFNALIDTNCVSPSSCSLPAIMQQQQATTADQQSPSPPSINSTEVIGRVQETAPVLTTTVTNGENINEGSATLSSSSSSSLSTTSSSSTSLLLSPVPQNQKRQQQQQQQQLLPMLSTTSSPSSSPVLHQQQLQTLSPATTNDQHHQQQLHQGLRQACAANQLQQQPQQEFLLQNSVDQQIGTLHLIKQEYEEQHTSNIYQQTSPSQQQQHLQLFHTSMSPPLERQTPTASVTVSSSTSNQIMQTFFNHGQNSSPFYEGVVTLKKEFDGVLLDASNASNVLSDESMIGAIDWWDANTPKSDGSSLMM